MYWKRMVVIVIAIATALFGLMLLFNWNSYTASFNSQSLFKDAFEAISLAFGFIGFDALDKGGYRKLRFLLRNILIIWLAVGSILAGLVIHYKITLLNRPLGISLYLYWILFASSFPLALYLNRKPNKTPSQSMSEDAS